MFAAVGSWSRLSQISVPCEENMYSQLDGWNSLWIFCFSSSNSLWIFCPGVSGSLEFPGICSPGVWTKNSNTAIYGVLNFLLIFLSIFCWDSFREFPGEKTKNSGSSREFKQRIPAVPGPGVWTKNYKKFLPRARVRFRVRFIEAHTVTTFHASPSQWDATGSLWGQFEVSAFWSKPRAFPKAHRWHKWCAGWPL